MEEYKVIIGREYIQDYEDLKLYLDNSSMYESNKNKILNLIDRDLDRLKISPYIGARLDSRILIPNDYRYLVSGDYLQFYKISNNIVKVYRLVYAKSDYLTTLKLL
ncbi:type II toxin-antitoxin system RelE/ParE family toxin [Ligilactobacillus salivarius]|uniref:Addiction module toxin RelE n=1 Tax=Ligilactobacillus salivarius TaxID=1624 RepID=A0A2U2M432_9LACO|nr:hypothetical protein [Ligilactobacillus salivarius]PWG51624.1 addiction module toxin RelE [Ligilactobacillus salivarius]